MRTYSIEKIRDLQDLLLAGVKREDFFLNTQSGANVTLDTGGKNIVVLFGAITSIKGIGTNPEGNKNQRVTVLNAQGPNNDINLVFDDSGEATAGRAIQQVGDNGRFTQGTAWDFYYVDITSPVTVQRWLPFPTFNVGSPYDLSGLLSFSNTTRVADVLFDPTLAGGAAALKFKEFALALQTGEYNGSVATLNGPYVRVTDGVGGTPAAASVTSFIGKGTAPAYNNSFVVLTNGKNFDLTLVHEDADEITANLRPVIYCPGEEDLVLAPKESVTLIHNAVLNRWLVLSVSRLASGEALPPAPSVLYPENPIITGTIEAGTPVITGVSTEDVDKVDIGAELGPNQNFEADSKVVSKTATTITMSGNAIDTGTVPIEFTQAERQGDDIRTLPTRRIRGNAASIAGAGAVTSVSYTRDIPIGAILKSITVKIITPFTFVEGEEPTTFTVNVGNQENNIEYFNAIDFKDKDQNTYYHLQIDSKFMNAANRTLTLTIDVTDTTLDQLTAGRFEVYYHYFHALAAKVDAEIEPIA